MFETHEEAAIQSNFFSDPGWIEWRFVTQRFHREWFYIDQHYIEPDTKDVAKRMLMIDDINELKALVGAKSIDSWVQDIFLVTPKKMNGTELWAIDRLHEIREFEPDPTLVNRNYIYKVDGPNQCYLSCELDGFWERLESILVYKVSSQESTEIQSHWAFSEAQSDRAKQIILAGIRLCGGNYVEGVNWVTTGLEDLGGRRPLEMLSPDEFCRVIDLIGRRENG